MRTLIVGLGNPILSDDGVGVRAARKVAEHLRAAGRMDVDVTEAAVGGLRLMELMVGYDRVILIDALVHEEVPPGHVRRLTLADLEAISPTQHSASAHDATLLTALESGRRLGLPLPQEVIIYAVGARHVYEFGEELSPLVAEALPRVIRQVLSEVNS